MGSSHLFDRFSDKGQQQLNKENMDPILCQMGPSGINEVDRCMGVSNGIVVDRSRGVDNASSDMEMGDVSFVVGGESSKRPRLQLALLEDHSNASPENTEASMSVGLAQRTNRDQ